MAALNLLVMKCLLKVKHIMNMLDDRTNIGRIECTMNFHSEQIHTRIKDKPAKKVGEVQNSSKHLGNQKLTVCTNKSLISVSIATAEKCFFFFYSMKMVLMVINVDVHITVKVHNHCCQQNVHNYAF